MQLSYFHNKAQTSIFIIISLIIVIVAAFVLYTSDIELFYSPEDRVEGQIRESIESCFDTSISSGVFYLQYQGGVIDTSSYIRFRDDYLLLGNDDSAPKLPNWDVEDDRYPTLFSMENELNTFVEEDVRGCINSAIFTLSDAFLIEPYFDELEVTTDINFETIDVEIYLPLDFKEVNGEIENSMNDFTLRKESKLGDLYSLAIEIYNVEEREYVFENLTLDQIFSASNYADRTTSMPSQGIEFSCTPRIWLKSDLKDTLANLNNNNFRYLSFEGTAPIEYRFESNLVEGSGLDAYFRNHYVYSLDNTKSSYENYEVNVLNPSVESFSGGYSRFSPYREFEVSPSNGEIVRSLEQGFDTGFGSFNFGCIQIYAHSYTIDYDLMIRLEDVSGESEDFFQFPIRVDIKQNEPKESSPSFIIPEENRNTLHEASYCVEETYEYPISIGVEDLSVVTSENDLLSDVNISFKCLSMTCDLGQTQRYTNSIGTSISWESLDPTYEGLVPYCYGGEFVAKKDGYFQLPSLEDFPGQRDLNDITSNSPYSTFLQMVPTKKFTLDQDSFQGRTWKSGIVPSNSCHVFSEENVDVYVQVENKNLNFESSAFYSKGEDLGDFSELELLVKEVTSYNVTAYYMKNDDMLGLVEIENWIPDVEFSNSLYLAIPVSDNLEDDNFLEYYEGSKELYGELAHCTGAQSTPFGISLR